MSIETKFVCDECGEKYTHRFVATGGKVNINFGFVTIRGKAVDHLCQKCIYKILLLHVPESLQKGGQPEEYSRKVNEAVDGPVEDCEDCKLDLKADKIHFPATQTGKTKRLEESLNAMANGVIYALKHTNFGQEAEEALAAEEEESYPKRVPKRLFITSMKPSEIPNLFEGLTFNTIKKITIEHANEIQTIIPTKES